MRTFSKHRLALAGLAASAVTSYIAIAGLILPRRDEITARVATTLACVSCGNEIPSGGKFCNQCGTPVGRPEEGPSSMYRYESARCSGRTEVGIFECALSSRKLETPGVRTALHYASPVRNLTTLTYKSQEVCLCLAVVSVSAIRLRRTSGRSVSARIVIRRRIARVPRRRGALLPRKLRSVSDGSFFVMSKRCSFS